MARLTRRAAGALIAAGLAIGDLAAGCSAPPNASPSVTVQQQAARMANHDLEALDSLLRRLGGTSGPALTALQAEARGDGGRACEEFAVTGAPNWLTVPARQQLDRDCRKGRFTPPPQLAHALGTGKDTS